MKGVVAFIGVVGLVPCLLVFDWGHGLARGLLLVGIGAGCLAFARWRAALAWPASKTFERVTWALLAVLAAAHLGQALSSAWRAGVLGKETEMGAINFRALRVVAAGRSPWAAQSLLDRGAFHALASSPEAVRCLEVSGDEAIARFERWWQAADVALMDDAVLRVKQGPPDCEALASQLHFLSYKYGPLTLLSYAPFVAVAGRAGIHVSHLTWLALLGWVLFSRARRWSLTPRVVQLAPALTVLLSGVVFVDFFMHSDCDLFAVLLAVCAWSALESGRPATAAVALAASVAAKLLPGALLVPVMLIALRRNPRAIIAFAVALLLFLGTAWLSSPSGVVDSWWTFNATRPGDSTAFSSALPVAFAQWLPLLGAATVLLSAAMTWRRETPEARLLAALGGVLAFLLTAKVFHNNYVVWFLPFFGWWLALNIGGQKEAREVANS